MDDLIRIDPAPPLELSAEALSTMTNAELLQVIHSLEARTSNSTSLEYDHRKYLQRHELERIVNMLQWLRRRHSNVRPHASQANGRRSEIHSPRLTVTS